MLECMLTTLYLLVITGQFWNVPVTIAPYTGLLYNSNPAVGQYIVNITTNSRTRTFTGTIYGTTWDYSDGPCLYVGNSQAGPSAEVENPNTLSLTVCTQAIELKNLLVKMKISSLENSMNQDVKLFLLLLKTNLYNLILFDSCISSLLCTY